MKIKRLVPNVLECFVILGSAVANIFMSVIDLPWATVTITSSLISGTALMSLNQTRKKIKELDKKLIANGRPKLNIPSKMWYWTAPSVNSVITIGLLSYYGSYNMKVSDPKLWIYILVAGGATIYTTLYQKNC